MKQKRMLLDVNEKPKVAKWIILAFQHVFAMFGATVLVPLLVNSAAGTEVLSTGIALLASGVGTLLYILCTKGKSPVYLGSSFAFISPMIVAYAAGGLGGTMTGVMVVGLIYMIVAREKMDKQTTSTSCNWPNDYDYRIKLSFKCSI